MTKKIELPHGLLTTCATILLLGCGESAMGPAPSPQAAGPTGGASAVTAACLTCAQSNCSSQAQSCSSTPGCGELTACLLGCGVSGTGCTQCSTTNANANSAAALYATCALMACPSACTPTPAGSGGGGGQTGAGGTASGGQTTGTGGTTSAPTNLILDPDFTNVSAYWSATANGGDAATLDCSGGQCCVTNQYSTWFAFSLGYPRSSLQAFAVQGGASYTLSFRARGSSVNSLEAKVGEAVDPYTTIYSSLVTVSSTLSPYTLQFTPSATHPTAGLVFNVELAGYGSVCFGGVSLVRNP
jgi:hypothetical protein